MQIERADGETRFEHHKRLIDGKLVDHTLADYDYAELAELVYGKEYSTDVARRMMYGSRYTLALLDEERKERAAGGAYADEIDAKLIELRKERQKFFDMRCAFNKAVRERSREEELHEILTAAVQSGNLPRLDYSPACVEPSDNDLLCSMNDLHDGIEIHNAWNT